MISWWFYWKNKKSKKRDKLHCAWKLHCTLLFLIYLNTTQPNFKCNFFFHGHRRLTGQQGKGEDHLLFHSTTSNRSQTFILRHLFSDIYFATLHVRWLSHTSNRTACIYQAATSWDLPPHQVTIWLIDDVRLNFVCLLVDLI